MTKINRLFLLSLVVFLLFSTVTTQSTFDPCVNYELNLDASRTTNSTDDASCRSRSSPGRWYRFDNVSAGQIITSCPNGTLCGAGDKIWINETIPETTNREVSVLGCVFQSPDCCSQQQPITMKACDGYFVYKTMVPLYTHVCIDVTAERPTLPSVATTTTQAVTSPVKDPCTSHENLTDWFSLMNDTNTSPQPANIFQEPGWYRFTNTATGHIMNACPTENQCGAKDAIWVNGTYAPDSSTISTVTLCLRTPNDCCERARPTQLKYCSGFPVYYLNPPLPESTYCLDNTVDIEMSATTSTTHSPTSITPTTTPTTEITTSTSTTSTMLTSTKTVTTTTITSFSTTPMTTAPTTTTPITSTTTRPPPPRTEISLTTPKGDTSSSITPSSSTNTEPTSEQIVSIEESTETITSDYSDAFPSSTFALTESQSTQAPAAVSRSTLSTEVIVAIVCAAVIVLGLVLAAVIVKTRND